MTLKNVQYMYAENLSPEEKGKLGISVDEGLVAIETRASKLKRKPIQLKKGIVEYLWSLDKK